MEGHESLDWHRRHAGQPKENPAIYVESDKEENFIESDTEADDIENAYMQQIEVAHPRRLKKCISKSNQDT